MQNSTLAKENSFTGAAVVQPHLEIRVVNVSSGVVQIGQIRGDSLRCFWDVQVSRWAQECFRSKFHSACILKGKRTNEPQTAMTKTDLFFFSVACHLLSQFILFSFPSCQSCPIMLQATYGRVCHRLHHFVPSF